jgi:2-C-methyl-D-erythritol 4-phosphate cytidylyltransferase
MSHCAVIVAAGSSRRMGFDKLAANLAGIPVLRRSVEAFLACPDIDSIVVVCPKDRFDTLLPGPFPKPVIRVDGGSQRQESVQNGVSAAPPDTTLIAVHDGARPLISSETISACLDAAKQYGAAVVARPITETIKRATPEGFTETGIDRDSLWFMETPQVFQIALLDRALKTVADQNLLVTDEVSAAETIGLSAKIIPSTSPNLKITTPPDIALATALLP